MLTTTDSSERAMTRASEPACYPSARLHSGPCHCEQTIVSEHGSQEHEQENPSGFGRRQKGEIFHLQIRRERPFFDRVLGTTPFGLTNPQRLILGAPRISMFPFTTMKTPCLVSPWSKRISRWRAHRGGLNDARCSTCAASSTGNIESVWLGDSAIISPCDLNQLE